MLRYSRVLIVLAAAVSLSSAQNIDDRDYKVTVDVELVQLPVSVHDKQGFPVLGLQREHFSIYEDKVQQNITVFRQEDIPLSMALVIDSSGSMHDKLDRLNTAALTFVKESNAEDETAIVSFGDDVFLQQDFTRNLGDLSRALGGISPYGYTALYDAVLMATKHLQQNGSRDKKVLLVVSDGEDNRSRNKLSEVVKVVAESKVIIYTVGLLNSGFSIYGPQADSGKKALKKLAEVTGGASFFPKNVNEVEKICMRIARDLRNQYMIGYRPSNEKMDGAWRKVAVQLNQAPNSRDLKVRTRQGYYAPTGSHETAQEIGK